AGASELVAARDPASGQKHQGIAALREIFQTLPGGRTGFLLLRLSCIGQLGELVAYFEENRARIATFFGLGRAVSKPIPAGEPSPLRQRIHRIKVVARETLLAYVAVCSVLQAINENKSIPKEIPLGRGVAWAGKRLKLPPSAWAWASDITIEKP